VHFRGNTRIFTPIDARWRAIGPLSVGGPIRLNTAAGDARVPVYRVVKPKAKMPESARETGSTRKAAPAGLRELMLEGERWTVTESRVPSAARDSVYLICFLGQSGRTVNVTLPLSSLKLSDAELTDVWLRCLLWEQDS
jgi:hypothetical protein